MHFYLMQEGLSPLMIATNHGHSDIVDMLCGSKTISVNMQHKVCTI